MGGDVGPIRKRPVTGWADSGLGKKCRHVANLIYPSRAAPIIDDREEHLAGPRILRGKNNLPAASILVDSSGGAFPAPDAKDEIFFPDERPFSAASSTTRPQIVGAGHFRKLPLVMGPARAGRAPSVPAMFGPRASSCAIRHDLSRRAAAGEGCDGDVGDRRRSRRRRRAIRCNRVHPITFAAERCHANRKIRRRRNRRPRFQAACASPRALNLREAARTVVCGGRVRTSLVPPRRTQCRSRCAISPRVVRWFRSSTSSRNCYCQT